MKCLCFTNKPSIIFDEKLNSNILISFYYTIIKDITLCIDWHKDYIFSVDNYLKVKSDSKIRKIKIIP